MAVIHPEDRVGYAPVSRSTRRTLHPAIGLAVGFGFIICVATLVHVVFNVVM